VAAPKAWSFERPLDLAAREAYTRDQEAAVLRALGEYHPGVPTVTGVEFGHTDPQLVLPYGGEITIDPAQRRLTVAY
jgi:muramoyltetrapeptide carboxypeptidase LdcA involved in peptidoglycan recycling